MMGTSDPQPSMFSPITLEQLVTADHPMRRIRPVIDTDRIRTLCQPLYAEEGRPSTPPEQVFLALLRWLSPGGHAGTRLGARTDREPGPPVDLWD